jgi:hypothetical protein
MPGWMNGEWRADRDERKDYCEGVNVIRQFLILQRFQPLIQNIFMSLACGAAHRPLDAVVWYHDSSRIMPACTPGDREFQPLGN